MKSKVDKLDVDKFAFIPVELSKLSDVVKKNVAEKTEYDEKASAIQTTDTSDLAKNADYEIKIDKIEKKISIHGHSDKYITAQEFNMLTVDNFPARLKKANLASKKDIADFVKKYIFR